MRVGVYLGHSPTHSRSVSLILSLSTGLVSPQFHVTHDDDFETVRKNRVLSSKWQQLAGLVRKPQTDIATTNIAPDVGIPGGQELQQSTETPARSSLEGDTSQQQA